MDILTHTCSLLLHCIHKHEHVGSGYLSSACFVETDVAVTLGRRLVSSATSCCRLLSELMLQRLCDC